jgi:hypothetical protein
VEKYVELSKGFNMVARSSKKPNSDASWINAQRRYCVGLRLDRTRDTSLEPM